MVRGFFLEGGSLGSILSRSQHAVGSSTAALGRRHRVPQGWVRSVAAALTGAHLPGHAPWGRHAQHPSAAGSCLQPPACRLPASPCCIRPHSLGRQSCASIPRPGTLPAPLCCLLFFRHDSRGSSIFSPLLVFQGSTIFLVPSSGTLPGLETCRCKEGK